MTRTDVVVSLPVGERLKLLLELRRISRSWRTSQEVENWGLARSTLSAILRTSNARLDTLWKLASGLDVPDELLTSRVISKPTNFTEEGLDRIKGYLAKKLPMTALAVSGRDPHALLWCAQQVALEKLGKEADELDPQPDGYLVENEDD